MIRFQDTPAMTEMSKSASPDAFKTIQSEKLSLDQAKIFWNQAFSKRDTLCEEVFLSEIYGRSQDEFHFKFEITPDIQAKLDAFSSENWDILEESQKESLIREFSSVLAEKLGIRNAPNIAFFYDAPNSCGAYYPNSNTITLNKALFQDSTEVVNTLAHEMRHAYQHHRSMMPECKQDILYRLNFQNYISVVPVGNGKYLYFTDYQDQLVEAEARAFANIFRKGVPA